MRCDSKQLLQWNLDVKMQLYGTIAAADRDCAADGESIAMDILAVNYHRRDAITFRAALEREGSVMNITIHLYKIETILLS